MKKLLKPRDILLLGAGGFLDIFEELRDPLGIMAKSYENMYGFVPRQYRKHNYSHLIWRTLKTGYIEKVLKGKEVYLRLTSEGGEKIARDFPLLALQKKRWDRKWRIVLFDIAELNRGKRDMLRSKLKELGFGMFQQSAYISPHNFTKDLVEFLVASQLASFVYVFEIFHTQMAIGDAKELARKVWNLDDLNERCMKLIEKISYLISTHGREVILNNVKKEKRKSGEIEEIERIKKIDGVKKVEGVKEVKGIKDEVGDMREEYLRLIAADPFLPKELLPSDWAFARLTSMVKKL